MWAMPFLALTELSMNLLIPKDSTLPVSPHRSSLMIRASVLTCVLRVTEGMS